MSWPLYARVIASPAHSLPGPVSGRRARAATTPSANPTIGAAARIRTAPATPSVSVTTFMQWCMP